MLVARDAIVVSVVTVASLPRVGLLLMLFALVFSTKVALIVSFSNCVGLLMLLVL